MHISVTNDVDSNPIDLLVRSQSLRLVRIGTPTLGNSPLSASHAGERPSKIRRVRSPEDCATSTTLAQVAEMGTASSSSIVGASTPLNLCSAEDMCAQLCAQVHSATFSGYLDTADHLRHH